MKSKRMIFILLVIISLVISACVSRSKHTVTFTCDPGERITMFSNPASLHEIILDDIENYEIDLYLDKVCPQNGVLTSRSVPDITREDAPLIIICGGWQVEQVIVDDDFEHQCKKPF